MAGAASAAPNAFETGLTNHAVTTTASKAFCAANVNLCDLTVEYSVPEYNPEQLAQVNKEVNSSITYKEEAVDTWTINPVEGDCEDFALTKMQKLMQAGYPRPTLRLMMVVLKNTGERHMVLGIETKAGVMVMDNRSKVVKPWVEVEGKYVLVAVETYKASTMQFMMARKF